MKKLFLENIKPILLAIILSSGLSIASAWTGPTATPPTGNVSAPINVGYTDQIKSGGFWANILGTTNGLLSTGNIGLTNVQSVATVSSRVYSRTNSDLSNNPPLTPRCAGDITDNRDNLPDSSTNPSVGSVGSICYDQWIDTINNNYPRADKYIVVSQTAGGFSYSSRPQLTFNDTVAPSWPYSIKNNSGILQFINGAGATTFSINQNGNILPNVHINTSPSNPSGTASLVVGGGGNNTFKLDLNGGSSVSLYVAQKWYPLSGDDVCNSANSTPPGDSLSVPLACWNDVSGNAYPIKCGWYQDSLSTKTRGMGVTVVLCARVSFR